MYLDKMDLIILRKLAINCRVPYESIARDLGVTSTTIKKRVNRLMKNGKLQEFVVELNSSAMGASRIILLIDTERKEDIDSFADEIGQSQMVESVSYLSNGMYFASAICCGLEDFSQLDYILRNLPGVKSIKAYPIVSQLQNPRSMTRMQLDVLRCLMEDPRMHASRVAEKIGRSAKGVRMAIARLAKSGIVRFSVKYSSFIVFIMAKIDRTEVQSSTIVNWFRTSVPSVWDIMNSTINDLLFVILTTDNLGAVHKIRRSLQKLHGLNLIETVIGEPMRHYGSKRKTFLKQITENTN